MRPIIGACFVCADCNHFSLCQNCYFTRPYHTLKVRGHTDKHKVELIVEPRQTVKKYVKCNGCGEMPIQRVRYKCDNCFDFDFCENCHRLYALEKKELKTMYSTSHKQYHTFTRLFLSMNQVLQSKEIPAQEDLQNAEGEVAKKEGDRKIKKIQRGRPSNKKKLEQLNAVENP